MHLIDLLPNKRWDWVAASYDALRFPENKDRNSAHHGDTVLQGFPTAINGLELGKQSACLARSNLGFQPQHTVTKNGGTVCKCSICDIEGGGNKFKVVRPILLME